MPTSPPGYSYSRPLSALANLTSWVTLTPANFTFAHARADGHDVAVWDVDGGAFLPTWREYFDPIGGAARIHFLATNVAHSHALYYGSGSATDSSNHDAVYPGGSGFEGSFRDLDHVTAGPTGEATLIPASTGPSDRNGFRTWRFRDRPILSIADLAAEGVNNTGYTGLREFGMVRDDTNSVTAVGGKYYVFFTRRATSNTAHHQAWRGESLSPDGPFSNFTLIFDPPPGIRMGYANSAQMIAGQCILYLTYGWSDAGTGAATPGLSIFRMQASSPAAAPGAWSAPVQCLSPSVFTDQVGGVCTDIGNFKLWRMASGLYWGEVEGENAPSGNSWQCYGATSSDGLTWTACNGGAAHAVRGASGTWCDFDVANPAPMELPDGTLAILVNGGENNNPVDHQLGWWYGTSLSAQFAPAVYNPVIGKKVGAYGCETSNSGYRPDGTPYHVVQWFLTDSNTADFHEVYPLEIPVCLLLARDNPNTQVSADSAFVGKLMPSGPWVLESRSVMSAHRDDGATPNSLAIWNSAAAPTPGVSTTFDPIRCIEMFQWPKSYAAGTDRGPGDVTLRYWDASGNVQYWNNSTGTFAWNTSGTGRNVAANCEDELIFRIRFDGTNYQLEVLLASDLSAVAVPTPIAASAMRPTAAGKYALVGEASTDVWQAGQALRYLHHRAYVATDPAVTVGAESSTVVANRRRRLIVGAA